MPQGLGNLLSEVLRRADVTIRYISPSLRFDAFALKLFLPQNSTVLAQLSILLL
jgi:hypothetical protein